MIGFTSLLEYLIDVALYGTKNSQLFEGNESDADHRCATVSFVPPESI